jgi:exosortase/archaeosortase family protein
MSLARWSSRIDSVPSGWGLRCDSAPFLRTYPSSCKLVQRILILAVLFASELIVLSVWLDGDSLVLRSGLIRIMHDWGPWILRLMVGFATIFITFAWVKYKAVVETISSQVAQTPVQWALHVAHCFVMIVLGRLSSLLYSGGGFRWADLLAASWFVAGISAIAFAGFAFLPWTVWVRLVRGTGHLWAYTLIAAVPACAAGNMIRRLWQPASELTFGLTKMFLSPFVSGIIANPATMVVGTQRFRVQIAPQCSGLEGVGLILAFGMLWLLLFRHDCRFPQTLALIPLGVTLMFVLNAVRVAALILIGNAGAKTNRGRRFSFASWLDRV